MVENMNLLLVFGAGIGPNFGIAAFMGGGKD